ncbi:aspartyl/asparaginyl beta-hydroxylase domain-containing protein [Pedobacter miscanthi]|uniref:Aspartyl/asparaginyl beta-hydroxylase domain-containing protein n=1 Tax=Pedobacter miscanthi TaxID=2259170 RepID=A0A366KYP8_9SPHI|nr:aspartyl/asparaginyl beta-hydroxylase domain-containing protein [Pedobacter miscanthi]RBQ06640.1 aspartyl/asparaginyl beta-hydroxylase domain-containing protein [Pedobacter miscanthi]
MSNITENHPTVTRYIQFNQQYDVQLLKKELAIAMTLDWKDHFNTKDYDGSWQSISLQSASGKEDDILSNYGVEGYKETALLKKLPYIKSILDWWQCPKESIRLLALHPGAEIKPHRDRGCNYVNGACRIHIPIQTNEQVEFIACDDQLVLKEGSCWYIDFDQTHAIKNNGEIVRVHLVIDALRNSWTDEVFIAHGYDMSAEQKEQQMDRESTLKVIEELERLNTPTSKQLIQDLKKTI